MAAVAEGPAVPERRRPYAKRIRDAVESAGSRRGAQMGVLRCDHPDIEGFIRAKDRAAELANFNLSVAVTDAFLSTAQAGAQWALVHRAERGAERDRRLPARGRHLRRSPARSDQGAHSRKRAAQQPPAGDRPHRDHRPGLRRQREQRHRAGVDRGEAAADRRLPGAARGFPRPRAGTGTPTQLPLHGRLYRRLGDSSSRHARYPRCRGLSGSTHGVGRDDRQRRAAGPIGGQPRGDARTRPSSLIKKPRGFAGQLVSAYLQLQTTAP
jgi:hypothetical protein